MKSQRINRKNFNAGNKSSDNIPVLSKHHNDVVEDLEFLYPLTNQTFTGEVKLDRAFTHYRPYSMTSNLPVWPSVYKEIGGYAECMFIADGSHTPAFDTDFIVTSTSEAWDTTDGTIHKVGFYYDGTYNYYTISIITV